MFLILLSIIICQAGQIISQCSNCQECDTYGRCTSCTEGFVLVADKCDSECISGYYWDYMTRLCYECPEHCETCTYRSRYSCDTCKIGFYGHRCHNKCPEECSSRECNKDNGECSKGCVVGYYGYRCNYNCSEGCGGQVCSQGNGICTNGCIDGYYGTTCQRCSEFCINRQCEEIIGNCTTGCIDGYYKYQGNCYTCKENCQTCSSYWSCTSCIDGFYTSYCNTPCTNCSPGGCSVQNGICRNGCRVGFYQGKTNCLHCPGNCSKCTSTEYCDVCKYGYFGKACEHKCPLYCHACDDINNCSACNKETGHCMNCTHDTSGQFCDHNCSTNCFRTSHAVSSCFQQNGTCLYGCVKGFTGLNCTEETSTPMYTSTRVPEIIGSVLGAVLFVAATVASILLIRWMYKGRVQHSRSANTERRYDDILGISIRDQAHIATVNEGRRNNEYPSSVDTARLYGNIPGRTTDDAAHTASLDVVRGEYETLGNPDYDNSVHIYDTTV